MFNDIFLLIYISFFMLFFFYFQLLNVIRDNNVIVIVGETGSGKTTQLTQVSVWMWKYWVGVVHEVLKILHCNYQ